jgi:hypothetical protein
LAEAMHPFNLETWDICLSSSSSIVIIHSLRRRHFSDTICKTLLLCCHKCKFFSLFYTEMGKIKNTRIFSKTIPLLLLFVD